jgi:hypothetical protein
MMQAITYCLKNGQVCSDQYYQDVAAFTDAVLAEAESRLCPLLEAFRAQVGESPRSQPECVFELLTLGVLWQVYAGRVPGLSQAPRQVLASLVRLRQRGGLTKAIADLARGVLSTFWLSPNGRHPGASPELTLDCLDCLLDWLAATDIFNQECKRLRVWRDFWAGQPAEKVAHDLASVIALAAWFEMRSEIVLGCYTPHVEQFLAETHPAYRWREDYIFCGRRRVEYHLNMVGTEILNRAFRKDFDATQQKLVIAPPCMRARPEGECQAQATPYGARCAGCTPSCRVHQLTRLGEKRGFQVLIMPDELSVFSSGAVKPVEGNTVGVIGVSCVLTNAPGGWETRELGVPAQGLLLDYCGCVWHWHKTGVPTDINFDQLQTLTRV